MEPLTNRDVADEAPEIAQHAVAEVEHPQLTDEDWNRIHFAEFLLTRDLGCKQ